MTIRGQVVYHRVAKALPTLRTDDRNEDFDHKGYIHRAQLRWEEHLEASIIWEHFQQGSKSPLGRGRWEERSTLRRSCRKDVTKLANFVKRIEKLYNSSGKPMHLLLRDQGCGTR